MSRKMRASWDSGVYRTLSIGLVIFQLICLIECDIKKEEKLELRDKTLKMFYHAYDSYMKHAYPADELMPLSCKGRYRGSEPDRGDIDETLGNFSLTLIDTLDTLAVLGNVTEFEKAVQLVIKDVTFDTDVVVSVFETNIRVLGGLLGGHVVSLALKKEGKGMAWYNEELLNMAVDIADRLLVAFNTTTGIPYSRVNLLYGIYHPMSRIVNEKDTCTACGGTMIMEFAALSRLTGNSIYEDKARKAMESIWHYRSRSSDLVGTVIDVHNGDWIRRDSGIGAGIDSYYEYCLKAYILLGDTTYLEKFNKHYAAINKYIRQGVMMLDVLMHQPDRPIRSFVDSLQAFWPGLQVLMGDLKPAIETHEMLYEVAKRHKFIPEAFTTNFDLYWSQHPLRPEFAESTYFLYEATKDPYYLEVGKHIVETLEEHAQVGCGFAAIKDLRTFTHEDKMDSFVLAETFKYLYLLFSEESDRILDIHNFVFTTEAHLLPLSLGNVKLNKNGERVVKNLTKSQESLKVDTQSSCPNEGKDKFSMREFARIVRKGYRRPKPVMPMCTPASSDAKQEDSTLYTDPNRTPKLLAENFQVGNTEHLHLLKEMGITVVQSNDGKVQLVHQAGTALTADDASDGIKFMQDMIQISKAKGEQASTLKPRVVQLMSPPFNGDLYFGAGAAQFGLDISNHAGINGEVVEAIPYNACNEITNKEELEGRIVIAQRGGCMFIDKVRRAQSCGAIGMIIIDNNEQSAEGQPMFAMSGDSHSEDVKIPSVFLFHKEGDTLRHHAKTFMDSNNLRLVVRLAGTHDKPMKAGPTEDVKKSEVAEQKNETHEEEPEEASSKVPSDVPKQSAGDEPDGESPEDVRKDVESETLNTESENVLDKMESSMEKKPSVVTFEEETATSTKTESHIGRNEEGRLVKYETTYSAFLREGSSHVRITTKMIPFETNALEIDKASLGHADKSDPFDEETVDQQLNAKDEEKQQVEAIEQQQQMNEQAPGIRDFQDDKTGKNEIKKQVIDDLGKVNEESEKAIDSTEQSVGDDKDNGIRLAEKGDTGTVDEDRKNAEADIGGVTDDDKNLNSNVGQRKHSSGDSENRKIEGRMDDRSQWKPEGELKEGTGVNEPKNVICNSAGCFSSLEELDMFNQLAIQVKSNLEELDQIESNVKKETTNMQRSLEPNEYENSELENDESNPNNR